MGNPPNPSAPSEALLTAWNAQRRASIAADGIKASYSSWRAALLVVVILVAVMQTLSGQLANHFIGTILAGSGALLMATVAVVGQFWTSSARLSLWVTTRAVSEELKAEVFRYLVRCGDYATGNADATLADSTAKLRERLDASVVAGVQGDDKPIPKVSDVDGYIKVRVDGQIDFHRRGVTHEAKVVSRNRIAQFGLAMIAALIGASGVFLDQLTIGAWVAVVATVGASVAAHVAAGRHEHLVLSYTSTVRRLEHIKSRWLAAPGTDPCVLVADCEAAISLQNEGWVAEFLQSD